MSTIEERLQSAADAVADSVTADSVRSLDLSGVPSRPNHTPPRRRRRFAILAPVAAAIAVVGVIAAVTALMGGTATSTTAQNASLGGIPPDYLTFGKVQSGYGDWPLTKEGVLRATSTGNPVAAVHLPRPYIYISDIAGAGNGRTFVIAGQNKAGLNYTDAFFLARFDPASRKVTVTALPVPKITFNSAGKHWNQYLAGLALSPTATRLAIAAQIYRNIHGRYQSVGEVKVYSLPSARVKVWTTPGVPIAAGQPRFMSWSAAGTLALNDPLSGVPYRDDVWLLNTSRSSGGSLFGHSRLVVRLPNHGWYQNSDGVLTPDGTKIVAAQGSSGPSKHGSSKPSYDSAVYEFSTATGKTISVQYAKPVYPFFGLVNPYPLWTNSSGSVFVVEMQRSHSEELGIVKGNRFTPLRGRAPNGPSWTAF